MKVDQYPVAEAAGAPRAGPPPMSDGDGAERPANDGRLATIRRALRYHRRWILGAVLLVLAAALIAWVLMPRRYVARADIWLDHGFDRLAPASDTASSASPLARNTEVRLLSSRELVAAVVDRLGLANVRGVGQPRSGPAIAREDARRQAIDTVRDNLRIETSGTSYAVAVRYAAADRVLATGILNTLAETYVADRRVGGVRGREKSALQAQVAAAREQTIRDEAAARGLNEAVGILSRPTDRATLSNDIRALDAGIQTATFDEQALAARISAERGGGEGRLSSPRLRELLANAAVPRPPEIDREIANEVRRLTRLNADLGNARTRLTLLRAARVRAGDELAAMDRATALRRRMDTRAAAARARYEGFASRYRTLVEEARRDTAAAYVISRASVPAARRTPAALPFSLLALLAALIAAIATVLVREATTKGFRTRMQAERRLGRPVIGMVPDLARVADADFPADDRMGPPDYLYNHRRSPFGLAFRGIHSGLSAGGEGMRSIAISSALPEEGKTTVALCLARSAALAGLRVVLVDCDGRRPAASRALSPYVKVGLAEVLDGEVDFRDAVEVDTPSGAQYLAQGSERQVSNGAVAAPQMAALIRDLEKLYDMVLLDCAPALALSEARELAAMADGVLLVARARVTPTDATRMAKDLLEQAGARIAAVTLTMVDP